VLKESAKQKNLRMNDSCLPLIRVKSKEKSVIGTGNRAQAACFHPSDSLVNEPPEGQNVPVS
jgi:hypothetical protein